MKSTGRATLIGEATAGANHFGGPWPLNDHFAVWMPVGRTYDIKTGKDWEGDGVAPDIAVDPKQALVIALEKAGVGHERSGETGRCRSAGRAGPSRQAGACSSFVEPAPPHIDYRGTWRGVRRQIEEACAC